VRYRNYGNCGDENEASGHVYWPSVFIKKVVMFKLVTVALSPKFIKSFRPVKLPVLYLLSLSNIPFTNKPHAVDS
jgi:hypothetical protein